MMRTSYRDFGIRPRSSSQRTAAAALIRSVLAEYGLPWEPTGADRDLLLVEDFDLATGGMFWAIERHRQVFGTAAYYPINIGKKYGRNTQNLPFGRCERTGFRLVRTGAIGGSDRA